MSDDRQQELINIQARLDMSNARFGEEMGVGSQTVSDWRNGKRPIRKQTILAARHLLYERSSGGDLAKFLEMNGVRL